VTDFDTSVTTSEPMNTHLPSRAYLLAPSWLLLVACPEPIQEQQDGTDDEVGTLDGEETSDPDTETDTDSDTTTDTSTETGPQPCMGPQDCNPEAPFCDDDSGECVTCTGTAEPDAACAALDADAPLCLEGSCVACTEANDSACGDTTPICDVDMNSCVGCSEHAQCPDSACNLSEGGCFDPEKVAHVDGDETCGEGDGSEESPYCSVGEALGILGGGATMLLHEIDGDNSYQEDLVIPVATAIFAAQGQSPIVEGSNGNPAFITTSALFLRGIEISDGPAAGLSINNGGTAWLDECTIEGHETAGLNIMGGTATVRRSRIVNNSGGGIIVDGGGSLFIQNSFVGGGTLNNLAAIDVIEGSASLLYSSVGSGFGTSSALRCEPGQSVTIRNSILVSAAPEDELQCPDATVEHSALEMELPDNISLGDFNTMWFSDYDAGDFSLVEGMYPLTLDDAAVWQSGDPATDINGDPRPTTDGESDVAGADIP